MLAGPLQRCVLLLLLLLSGCTRQTVLEIGDGTRAGCRFYVSDETPLVLTADTVRYCAGHFEILVLGGPT